jgi:hypothetical protein
MMESIGQRRKWCLSEPLLAAAALADYKVFIVFAG